MLKWLPLGVPLYMMAISLLNYFLQPGHVRLALTMTIVILSWVVVVIARRKTRASTSTNLHQ